MGRSVKLLLVLASTVVLGFESSSEELPRVPLPEDDILRRSFRNLVAQISISRRAEDANMKRNGREWKESTGVK
jgi:hypothetical protein